MTYFRFSLMALFIVLMSACGSEEEVNSETTDVNTSSSNEEEVEEIPELPPADDYWYEGIDMNDYYNHGKTINYGDVTDYGHIKMHINDMYFEDVPEDTKPALIVDITYRNEGRASEPIENIVFPVSNNVTDFTLEYIRDGSIDYDSDNPEFHYYYEDTIQIVYLSPDNQDFTDFNSHPQDYVAARLKNPMDEEINTMYHSKQEE